MTQAFITQFRTRATKTVNKTKAICEETEKILAMDPRERSLGDLNKKRQALIERIDAINSFQQDIKDQAEEAVRKEMVTHLESVNTKDVLEKAVLTVEKISDKLAQEEDQAVQQISQILPPAGNDDEEEEIEEDNEEGDVHPQIVRFDPTARVNAQRLFEEEAPAAPRGPSKARNLAAQIQPPAPQNNARDSVEEEEFINNWNATKKARQELVDAIPNRTDSSLHINSIYREAYNPDESGESIQFEKALLTGDFNFPEISWGLNRPSLHKFQSFLNSRGLTQHITFPTRLGTTSSNILDLIISSDDVPIYKLERIPPLLNSDHLSIHCVFSPPYVNTISTLQAHKPSNRLNYRKCNFSALNAALASTDWDIVFSTLPSPSDKYAKFISILSSLILSHTPTIPPTKHRGPSNLARQLKRVRFSYSKALKSHYLLKKLQIWSVKPSHLLVGAFLKERTFSVMVNGSLDNKISPIPSGVPQGTVSGPLLFLIYINDLLLKLPPNIPVQEAKYAYMFRSIRKCLSDIF
ncbi:hypothetical protein CRE_07070 [Caenorhabditis remanei]|uniref:Endonuclease/exonuclease/phosphatase domain-containing protein n=1 Tax=Caenorhabditis remanei TaxID=31234 RepID=E3NJG1_CAERE|nr:hypothetical protein CRE_07070 [Caenorhabditis remanei]